jgi:hypothetical protein
MNWKLQFGDWFGAFYGALWCDGAMNLRSEIQGTFIPQSDEILN